MSFWSPPPLASGFRPPALDKLLEEHAQVSELALVGHEPDLGIVTQALLKTDIPCTLKKGAIVTFKITGRHKAELLQMVTGGGKVINSRAEVLERLQEEHIHREAEKGSA